MTAGRIDRFEFSKQFEKAFAKLIAGEQQRVGKVLALATVGLAHPLLHCYELKGTLAGITSLNAGGDLRVLCRIYAEGDDIVALAITVGTHSQLYG